MIQSIQNQSLSGIEIADDGSTIRFAITDTIIPYNVVEILCENVILFQLHRTPGDSAPYFLGDICWVQLSEQETLNILSEMQYEYTGLEEQPVRPDSGSVYKLRFEGAVSGVVLCEQLNVIRPAP